MEDSHVYNFNEFLRAQRKVVIQKQSKNANFSKSSKINNFRNSIFGKLFRMKSQSEKSLKHDDSLVDTIPSTIYLTPNTSLPRDDKSINRAHFMPKTKPISNPVRHSCSDFSCRRSNTFCMYGAGKEINKSEQNLKGNQRLISPPNSAFYSVTMDEIDEHGIQSPMTTCVSHSKSVPLQLSQSQQNITQMKKSNIDIHFPSKRDARKKSLFNCSLFRKRSSSRSKSTDKIHQHKPSVLKCLDKSKHIAQLNDEPSILSDRCLTLPNLKSSEVDLTNHPNNAQLFSIDLIKDYLNRSDNALSTTTQRNSVDTSSYYQYNPQSHPVVSIQNSPLSLPTRIYESLIMDSSQQTQSFDMKPTTTSAYNDMFGGQIIQSCDSSVLNNSALNNSIYSNSVDINKFVHNNPRSHFARQTSAPIYVSRQTQTQTKLPHLSNPPTGAVEFWTRPYQEKIKASRRRLLDDKVGSKEALLRSMSPQNVKTYEGENTYDITYHLKMIPEPSGAVFRDELDSRKNWITEPIIRSNSFYNSISQDFQPTSLNSPIVENRLSESPKPNMKRLEPIGKLYTGNYIEAEEMQIIHLNNIEDSKGRHHIEESNPIHIHNKNGQEIKKSQKMKSYYNESNFEDSLPKMKSIKNIRASTELIITRTPTPPHSFAESSISSAAAPVPKEFLNDPCMPTSKPNHHLCNVNLLYSSDNSSESHEDFAELDQDSIVPVPPPRTDSVIRSMQFQQNNDPDKSELEYDIADDFIPIFSGANIDKCDIEQYHKWLEKLPYKLSEFPEIIHSRKSAVTGRKSIPSDEPIDMVPERIEILELKHLKQNRKSIKSWNMSELSKSDYEPSNEMTHHTTSSTSESSSMKKSFSCDHSLHSSDKGTSIEKIDNPIQFSQNLTTTETTFLKQYSHLYSLKFSPSHDNVLKSIQSVSILKSNRSKSIDLRNFISNNKSIQLINSAKCSENRKSAPNTEIHLEK